MFCRLVCLRNDFPQNHVKAEESNFNYGKSSIYVGRVLKSYEYLKILRQRSNHKFKNYKFHLRKFCVRINFYNIFFILTWLIQIQIKRFTMVYYYAHSDENTKVLLGGRIADNDTSPGGLFISPNTNSVSFL